MRERPQKIAVTGGAGFIGTHLCQRLLSLGHDVRVLDLVEPVRPVAGVTYELGNICHPAELKRHLQGVDAVYHLAALVSVVLCQEKPLESYQTNLLGTCAVLDAVASEMKAQGKAIRVIFAGSSVIYGDSAGLGEALREDRVPGAPLSFYGAQKLGSEQAIRLYRRSHGVPAVIFRIFNVYGQGQDASSPYSGVISLFARTLQQGGSLKLNGGGVATRDFVAVQDVARGFALAIDLPESACDGTPINLGTGTTTSIRALAETLLRVAQRIPEGCALEIAPERPGDVPHSLADITRAYQILGWRPEIHLESGLAELLGV